METTRSWARALRESFLCIHRVLFESHCAGPENQERNPEYQGRSPEYQGRSDGILCIIRDYQCLILVNTYLIALNSHIPGTENYHRNNA
jgi:hypothetical protein